MIVGAYVENCCSFVNDEEDGEKWIGCEMAVYAGELKVETGDWTERGDEFSEPEK